MVSKRRWHPPRANYDSQFGSYPTLPWTPYEDRSPFQHWDNQYQRRNYGEPIHEEFDIQDGFFPGPHTPYDNLKNGMMGQVAVLVIACSAGLAAYLTMDGSERPAVHELPLSVKEYLVSGGMERVVNRPYDPVRRPVYDLYTDARQPQ